MESQIVYTNLNKDDKTTLARKLYPGEWRNPCEDGWSGGWQEGHKIDSADNVLATFPVLSLIPLDLRPVILAHLAGSCFLIPKWPVMLTEWVLWKWCASGLDAWKYIREYSKDTREGSLWMTKDGMHVEIRTNFGSNAQLGIFFNFFIRHIISYSL